MNRTLPRRTQAQSEAQRPSPPRPVERSIQAAPTRTAATRLAVIGTLLVAAWALTGCASGGGAGAVPGERIETVTLASGDGSRIEVRRTSTPPSEQRLDISPDEAWAALPAVYRAVGLDPDIRNPSIRQLGVDRHRFSARILDRQPSDFFNCGVEPGMNRPLANQGRIDAQIISSVRPRSDGTAAIVTQISAIATPRGGSGGRSECRSSGLLEQVIVDVLLERTGRDATGGE